MKKNRINEATGAGSSGHFKVPIVLAPQEWEEKQLSPFNDSVYSYKNAELAYEEADGDFKESPEQRVEIEKRTIKLSKLDTYLKKFYAGQNDEDGSNIADVENPEEIIDKSVGPLKEGKIIWEGKKKIINKNPQNESFRGLIKSIIYETIKQ